MSIYISGVEFPKEETGVLPVIIFADGSVENLFSHEKIGKAMPVQEHGRLIDASVLMEDCMKKDTFLAEMLFRKLSNAPTIIPADKEKTE